MEAEYQYSTTLLDDSTHGLGILSGQGEQVRMNIAAQGVQDRALRVTDGEQNRLTIGAQGVQDRLNIGAKGIQDRLNIVKTEKRLTDRYQPYYQTGTQTRLTDTNRIDTS